MATHRQLMDVVNSKRADVGSIPADVRTALKDFHNIYDSLEAESERSGLGLHHGFLRGALLGLLEDLRWSEREYIPKNMLVADRLIGKGNAPTPESKLMRGMWILLSPIWYIVSDNGSCVENVAENWKYPFVEQAISKLHGRYGYSLKPTFLGRTSVDNLTRFFNDYGPAKMKGAYEAYLEGRAEAYSTQAGQPRKGHEKRILALDRVLLKHF